MSDYSSDDAAAREEASLAFVAMLRGIQVNAQAAWESLQLAGGYLLRLGENAAGVADAYDAMSSLDADPSSPQEAASNVVPFAQPASVIPDEDGEEEGEELDGEDDNTDVDDDIDTEEQAADVHNRLDRALATLPEPLPSVLRETYGYKSGSATHDEGLCGNQQYYQRCVADRVGISQPHVSRCLALAMRKLRHPSRGLGCYSICEGLPGGAHPGARRILARVWGNASLAPRCQNK
jgi:hypothetical protein